MIKKWTLATVWKRYRLDKFDRVTACASCNQASCWAGEFYCDEAKTADIKTVTVDELLKLGPLEDPSYWLKTRQPRTD